ncbi:F0F1 ATP synthase subunit A [Candidatus Falkowbacteria bacterium]|nr:MAG: F0F1 ATP synthase subunit A [Candidatus Falkowbacteria bacterium]
MAETHSTSTGIENNKSQSEASHDTSSSATGHEELVHEHTLFAEPIFELGPLTVTNSLLTSWIAVCIILVIGLAFRAQLRAVPKKLQNIVEMVMEKFLEIFDAVTGSRKQSIKLAPFVMSFFVLILINNWLGLIPGVGSIGQVVMHDGHKTFIPFLRGGTADLNTTLALASIAVVASHIFGVVAVGAWTYLNKFINIKAIAEIPKKFLKDPTIIIVNPIKAFVGLIEIIGEVAKVASLSFRLFGNIFAGEVLLASMAAIIAFAVPIPFMFLEIIVGLIQALIFAILVLIYVSISTTAEEH